MAARPFGADVQRGLQVPPIFAGISFGDILYSSKFGHISSVKVDAATIAVPFALLRMEAVRQSFWRRKLLRAGQ